jgi:hypothetical protein
MMRVKALLVGLGQARGRVIYSTEARLQGGRASMCLGLDAGLAGAVGGHPSRTGRFSSQAQPVSEGEGQELALPGLGDAQTLGDAKSRLRRSANHGLSQVHRMVGPSCFVAPASAREVRVGCQRDTNLFVPVVLRPRKPTLDGKPTARLGQAVQLVLRNTSGLTSCRGQGPDQRNGCHPMPTLVLVFLGMRGDSWTAGRAKAKGGRSLEGGAAGPASVWARVACGKIWLRASAPCFWVLAQSENLSLLPQLFLSSVSSHRTGRTSIGLAFFAMCSPRKA